MKIQNIVVLGLGICALALSSCQNDVTQNDNVEECKQVEGKRIVKKSIAAGMDYKAGDRCYGGLALYNEKGLKTHDYDYSSCDTVFKEVHYEYDEQDRVVHTFYKSYLEDVEYNWIYNGEGRLTEIRATEPTSSFPYSTKYIYNESGVLKQTNSTMDDGSAFRGTCLKTYLFENGKKVETWCFSGEECDVMGYRIIHLYDENDLEIGTRVYRQPGDSTYDEGRIYYEYY